MPSRSKISNWGNYPRVDANLTEFVEPSQASSALKSTSSVVVRGAGLSYGDASLAGNILSTLRFNKIRHFDETIGMITVEAGATLDEILQVIVPKGWFLPVTPGTKFITVGGAVAGDVHGKNHHVEGSFCRYVTRLEVMLADGAVSTCEAGTNAELFKAVCGGLGLCGVILTIQFSLKRIETAFIRQRNVIIRDLDEMIDRLKEFESSTYSVAWVDCLARGKRLGRGVLMLGEHANRQEVSARNPLLVHQQPLIRIPVFFPSFVLNSFSVRTFNFLFYTKHRIASKDFIVHYDPYFYPLDFMRDWNKLYGRRGFLQYQFVIPFDNAAKGLRDILGAISRNGASSFLSVLKALGPSESSTISFPLPGLTLALDFPVSDGIFPFLDQLDKVVVDLGGRIYLVKDARMSPDAYWKGYPQAGAFKDLVNRFDPSRKFSSALSKRLQMI